MAASSGTRDVRQYVWAPVEDDDAWVLAALDAKFGGTAHLTRAHAPPGVSLKLAVPEEAFATYFPATGQVEMELVEDLAQLEEVNEAVILHTLRARYEQDQIYTSIGPILIAINPFKNLEACSIASVAGMVAAELQNESGVPPPHILKVVRAAYHGLCSGEAQSILISGESGAGKTESAKLCLRCLAEISNSEGASTAAALEAAVLLEAFGNAKTAYNDNSSRFGRWTEVRLDRSMRISACRIQAFLMERSRVVVRAAGERNYHLFHYMLAGSSPTQRAEFKLLPAAPDYNYLREAAATDAATATGALNGKPGKKGAAAKVKAAAAATDARVSDAEEWAACIQKLELLGFKPARRAELFRACSAVLLLGNLRFVAPPGGDGEVRLEGDVEGVAELLQVAPDQLRRLLTYRSLNIGQEERASAIDTPMNLQGCVDMRDALAKAVYTQVFDWCISMLNKHLAQHDGNTTHTGKEAPFMGLLDVFGFENFDSNSFEQLCINYTNEKLQAHFIDSVIKLVYSDMAREGVQAGHISFPDNSASLELIEGNTGVLALLTDECAIPKGSELGYVTKMHAALIDHAVYVKPKAPAANRLSFGIKHYAGEVQYQADGWLDKNRGLVQAGLYKLLSESGSEALATAFASFGLPSSDVGGRDKRREPPTTAAAFRLSLLALSTRIRGTTEQYIRCIKPNAQKVPGRFIGSLVHRQLRYTGVSAVTELYRAGYPCSMTKAAFARRYRCIAFAHSKATGTPHKLDAMDETSACLKIIELAPTAPSSPSRRTRVSPNFRVSDGTRLSESSGAYAGEDHLMGITKIFLREHLMRSLERSRQTAWRFAVLPLQCAARRRTARRLRGCMLALRAAEAKAREAIKRQSIVDATKCIDEIKAMLATPLAQGLKERGLRTPNASELHSQMEMLRLGQSVLDCFPEGATVEVRELQVTSEPVPTQGDMGGVHFRDMKLMSSICKGGLSIGVQFNDKNMITSILTIGSAVHEKKLRVGDLLLKVDGVVVTSSKTAIPACEGEKRVHTLTVARVHDDELDAQETVPAGDGTGAMLEGWLMVTTAKDGRASELPRRQYVVLERGSLVCFEDAGRQRPAGSHSVSGAQCCQPGPGPTKVVRSGKAQPEYVDVTPAAQSFIDAFQFPFSLSWANGDSSELVMAASSRVERAKWTSALADVVARVNEVGFRPGSQTTSGWLMKRGGRRGPKPKKWQKRWFVLDPLPSYTLDYHKKPPTGANVPPRGSIKLLLPAEVFVPVAGDGVTPPAGEFAYPLCLSSQCEDGSRSLLALSAVNKEEQQMWVDALRSRIEDLVRRRG